VINTLRIYEELSQALDPKAAHKLASVLGAIYEDLQQTVTKAEFNDLRQVVRDLAEAQKRTETRVEELAEAQKRTETRLGELAEAQKRTEARVEELAAAQKRTEARVEELAAAQAHTEQALARLTVRVDQLAVRMDQLTARLDQLTERVDQLAVRMDQLTARLDQLTERVDQLAVRMDQLAEQVGVLSRRLDDTNRQLGGLSATVGYTLEDIAYRGLPPLLQRDHGLVLAEPLRRDWLTDAEGRDVEVNILGRGTRDGETVWVIGEGKAQLSRNDVDRFLKRRVEPLTLVLGKVLPVLVTYMVTSRDVPQYAQAQGVALYYSYQFNPGNAGSGVPGIAA
jgi:predicted  nucleic acid-binding Zn-ribbon protein